ncbi:LysR substrate-binding domain-containing protein [Pontibacter sp. G13]|uniref:LysR substrate-binding domain-containing protein n=1 Tax=Pontibacter sp. G13 TaxID=3074898 RepID=UPI00288A00B2|nr:LysR substrate-binding domain-containing protein [Pontibacter sp. G13]WNJ18288.1 LysR substrate-binding domain-containing protein [Pontibacter sp. G13]
MHYTLHQLQILVETAKQGSITKAAEAMHLSQPAVSIQLKKLQDQFDVPLVEVIGRKLFVTDFGQQIVEAAERILSEVEQIEERTLAFKGHLAGDLKISIVSTGKYIMPFFLTEFLEKHTAIKLRMDVTNKASVVQHLEQNEVDFALVSVLPDNLALEQETLMENRLHLVGKAGSKQKNWDINQVSLIFREPGSATRLAMERFLKEQHISPQRTMTLQSNEAVKQAILAGLGYSLMPLIGLRNELKNGSLQILDYPELPIVTNWSLVWPKGKRFSPAAKAYLEFLRAQKAEIMKAEFSWYLDH